MALDAAPLFVSWEVEVMNLKEGLDFIVIILLAAIAYVDFKTMEIPDPFNLAIGACGLISVGLVPEISPAERIVGAVVVSGLMLLMCKLIPGAFGGGDIKLVFVMGIYLGWKKFISGIFLGFLFGGIEALYLLITRKARMGEGAKMAFGPALCSGFILSLLTGEKLLLWYLGLFT